MLYLDAHNLGVIYLNKFLKLHKGESLPVYDPYLKYLPSYEKNWLSQFCYPELQMESTDQILELEPIQNDQGFLEDFIYPFFPVEKVEAPGSRVKRAAAMVSGFLRRVDPRICNHQFLCVARKPV